MSTEKKLPGLDELIIWEDDFDKKGKSTTVEEDPTDNTEEEQEQEEVEEVEEVVETDTTDIGDEEDSEESDEIHNSYKSQLEYLQALGLVNLPQDYEFDGTAEGLEEVIQMTKDNIELMGAASIWNRLPDKFKVVLEYALAGGTDVNKVQQLISASSLDFDTVDIEDEDIQERVMREYFRKTTQYDDSRIDKLIKKYKLAGDLEEEASTALEELKEIVQKEKTKAVEEAKAQREQQQQLLIESYQKFNQTVDTLDLDKRKKQRIVEAVWKAGKHGEFENVTYFNYVDYMIKSNPEHLAQLTQLYLDYDPQKGLISDSFKKKVDSEKNRSLKDAFDTFGNSTKSKIKGGGGLPQKKDKATEIDKLKLAILQNRQQN